MRIALVNLLVASILGATLRFIFIREIPGFEFRKILHAHSHIAMLGWAFSALYILLTAIFLGPGKLESRYYRNLFWLNQVMVGGMLIAFPIQGYGPFAILFSTGQMVLSYFFAFRLLKDLRQPKSGRPTSSGRMLEASIFWLIFSTLGLWAMGPIMAMHLKGSSLYVISVQFYLHFQFNGWFLFSVLAIIFRVLENEGVNTTSGLLRLFYFMLVSSCALSFALVITWANPAPVYFWINGTGVMIQLAAMVIFFKFLWVNRRMLAHQFEQAPKVMMIACVALGLKTLIQTAVAVPHIAVIAYTIRFFVIGFIHLLLLGVITTFILGISLCKSWFRSGSKGRQIGLYIFLSGVISSECLLFLQGILYWAQKGQLPYFYEALFAVSALMPVGLGWFLLNQFFRFRLTGEGRN